MSSSSWSQVHFRPFCPWNILLPYCAKATGNYFRLVRKIYFWDLPEIPICSRGPSLILLWYPSGTLGPLGAKRKIRTYDMGCDCGKSNFRETEECQEKLNRVRILCNYWPRNTYKERENKKHGNYASGSSKCVTGHTPWYDYLQIKGEYGPTANILEKASK